MAGRRRARPAVDLTPFAEGALRIGGATLLETLALVIWNIGTRSPLRVARDMWAGLVRRRALFSSAVRVVVGVIFFVAACVTLLPAIDDATRDLLPIELLTVVVALAIERLVGDDLRAFAAGREPFPRS